MKLFKKKDLKKVKVIIKQTRRVNVKVGLGEGAHLIN